MNFLEDTGKYYRRNMKKPATREGQKGTGNKRATIGQLHDGIICQHNAVITVSRVLQFLIVVFFLKFAINTSNSQWD